MEFAKRITIFFAGVCTALLPITAYSANRSEGQNQGRFAEKHEANAAAAVILLVGVGIVLANSGDEEA